MDGVKSSAFPERVSNWLGPGVREIKGVPLDSFPKCITFMLLVTQLTALKALLKDCIYFTIFDLDHQITGIPIIRAETKKSMLTTTSSLLLFHVPAKHVTTLRCETDRFRAMLAKEKLAANLLLERSIHFRPGTKL